MTKPPKIVMWLFLIGALSLAATPIPAFAEWIDNGTHWSENGIIVKDHCFYDPDSDAWYWADADGSIATDKDVFIPRNEADRSQGGKWVRFLADRTMKKGEDYRYGGWYYFDLITGEMAKGTKYINADGYNKWVYYDWITGKMAHGEAYLNYDAEHTGWYLFEINTGEMLKGMQKLSDGRTVYYDPITGKMQYGSKVINGRTYYFNTVTGNLENQWGENESQWDGTVFWTPRGRSYHKSRNCPSLDKSPTILSGTIAGAGNRTLCKLCG